MEYKMIIHNASEELPQQSGTYLVQVSDIYNIWQVLGYSTKYKKFNTYDSLDNDNDSIKGYLWSELPELNVEEKVMDEQFCDNCKYNLYSVHKEPCCSCVVLDDKLSNFVPAEVEDDD